MLYRETLPRPAGTSQDIIDEFADPAKFAEYEKLMRPNAEWLEAQNLEDVRVRADDGILLHGYYLKAEKPCGKLVMFHHGFTSKAIDNGNHVKFFHDLGYEVLLLDLRAHGESEGRYIGFDLFESEDALRWIEFLKKRAGKPVRIILHGFSLGGATVMKMSSRVPEEVRFIVEDSGYTEACTLLSKSPLFPLLKIIHKRLTGLDLKDTDVRPDLERARVPILFVQGTEDRLVPAGNGPYLYEYYQGPKDCFFVPGARHIESMYVDPDGYAEKLEGMIRKYF